MEFARFIFRFLIFALLMFVVSKVYPYTFFFFNPFLTFFVFESYYGKKNSGFLIRAFLIGLIFDTLTSNPFGVSAFGFLTAAFLIVKLSRIFSVKKVIDFTSLIFVILVFEVFLERFIVAFFEYSVLWNGFFVETVKFVVSFFLGFFIYLFFKKDKP